jgi:hypothetical protein
MRVIAAFFGLYAPYALTSHVSVFSHDFKRFERFTKLATSSINGQGELPAVEQGHAGCVAAVSLQPCAGCLEEDLHLVVAVRQRLKEQEMPQPLVPMAIIQLIDHRRERRPEAVALLDPKGLHVRVCATQGFTAEQADPMLRIGLHPVRVLLIDFMTEGGVALKFFFCGERVHWHGPPSPCHAPR